MLRLNHNSVSAAAFAWQAEAEVKSKAKQVSANMLKGAGQAPNLSEKLADRAAANAAALMRDDDVSEAQGDTAVAKDAQAAVDVTDVAAAPAATVRAKPPSARASEDTGGSTLEKLERSLHESHMNKETVTPQWRIMD